MDSGMVRVDAAGTDGGPPGEDGGPADAGGPMADAGCVIRCGSMGACCTADEECVGEVCRPACAGTRCGDDSLCCGTEELCVGGACIPPGAECTDESDCVAEETCEPLVRRCIPIPEDAVCRYVPPSGVFEPALDWHWDEEQSTSIPLVVQLTDDNGDGAITPLDTPDVVAVTYASNVSQSHLTALSGDDGTLLWQSPIADAICGGTSAAAADLDGDGSVEIVAILASGGGCGSGGQYVAAFSHIGEVEWRSSTTVTTRYGSVAIADLEGDGSPEIVAGGSVFTADGTFRWSAPELNDILGTLAVNAPTVADIDGDDRMEVLASNVAFNDDGSVLWRSPAVARGQTAIAHVIDDPSSPGPQVVSISETTFAILDGATGNTVFGPIPYETSGVLAGPPTVADFDADGRPEIGVAGDNRYVLFDPDIPASPHVLWSVASEDSSTGSVGSTVFDFDFDGSAEVLYGDECHLRILSGMDGSVLWYASNTSLTAVEYPVVADVDGDGHAEVVVVSNGGAGTCGSRSLPFDGPTQGVRVFQDVLANWVPTRSIWNQHAYHVDNIRDDGTVPAREARSWEGHNTYRLNTLLDPDEVTLAPDLVVTSLSADVRACPARVTLRARVENRGARGVPAGIPVAFFAGAAPDRSALLGVALTSRILLSGAGEWVELEVSEPPLDADNLLELHAIVDDDGTGDAVSGGQSECDEANNAAASITVDCTGLI